MRWTSGAQMDARCVSRPVRAGITTFAARLASGLGGGVVVARDSRLASQGHKSRSPTVVGRLIDPRRSLVPHERQNERPGAREATSLGSREVQGTYTGQLNSTSSRV